ncbi:MAG: hypothetical protein K2Q20_10495 [Phycisphaerales bacterium]|nr:hypothetical protein [Phycisphaerales bacterium]
MRFVGSDQPRTDDGWIYATIEPATADITASGVIGSCVECHSKAPYGRLFGFGH